ncbi:hypothetical protein [Roseibium sediminicola]|uniref:Uncharacterized protein n=1 Tax=Roseibium sediminicola TaxID=2933272 RepID=A0ABT0GTM0_9HYPH|nr:hypothetical protein [Roseibium sp. CAU 1639]MCK7612789.1 hypothetical protein [Roseibium sp. CAU 1639]
MHLRDTKLASRTAPATRARTRSGKLRDMAKDLISPCTLYDLVNGNTGIILPENGPELPDTFYIEDEGDLSLGLAHVQQRSRPHLEIAYLDPPVPLSVLAKRAANGL